MSNTIFNAQNLPINGTLDSLGPVNIDSIGETKKSKNNKSFRSVKVSDGSGSISIMMWEPSCFLALAPGQSVVFSGTMKREEYPPGTAKLRSESGITMAAGGGAVSSPQTSSTGGGTPQGGAPSAVNQRANTPATAIIDYGLACVRYARVQMRERNEPIDDALSAAIYNSSMYAYKEGRRIAAPSAEDEAKKAEAARKAEEARIALEEANAQAATDDDSGDIPY